MVPCPQNLFMNFYQRNLYLWKRTMKLLRLFWLLLIRYILRKLQKQEWCNAIREELLAIYQTWNLVDFPKGKKCSWAQIGILNKLRYQWKHIKAQGFVGCKWILLTTRDLFWRNFLFDIMIWKVRTFIALVIQLNWLVYYFVVKFAFLNGELEVEIYVSQLEAFIINCSKNNVCWERYFMD